MLGVRFLSCLFFFSSRRRHTRFDCDWSSDVCSSDLKLQCSADAVSGEREWAEKRSVRLAWARAENICIPAIRKKCSFFVPSNFFGGIVEIMTNSNVPIYFVQGTISKSRILDFVIKLC